MKVLTLEEILSTCNHEQTSQYNWLLRFTSIEERDLWLYYYRNLLHKYCDYINVFKTVGRISIQLSDELIKEDIKEWNE